MTNLKLLSLSLIAAVSVSACVSTERNAPKPEAQPEVSASVAQANETPQTGLPGQVLAPGECGLFLWERRESPDFVFFAKGASEDALFWYEDDTRDLTRIGVSGDVFGQFLTEQTFALADGRVVQLQLEPGELLVGGQRIPEASIKVVDAEGWATLMPVAGVTACQPTVTE